MISLREIEEYMKYNKHIEGRWQSPFNGVFYSEEKSNVTLEKFIKKCSDCFGCPSLQLRYKNDKGYNVNIVSQPFSYKTLIEIWDKIEEKYFYEYINPKYNIIFFDFEQKVDPSFDEKDFMFIVEQECSKYLNNALFCWTKSNDPNKNSYHLYIPNYYFEDKNVADQLKNFTKKLNIGKYQNMLDLNVYRKSGSLRMVGCKKPDSPYYHSILGDYQLQHTFMTPSLDWFGFKCYRMPNEQIQEKEVKSVKVRVNAKILKDMKQNQRMKELNEQSDKLGMIKGSQKIVKYGEYYFIYMKLSKPLICPNKKHVTPEIHVKFDKDFKECVMRCSCKEIIY